MHLIGVITQAATDNALGDAGIKLLTPPGIALEAH